MTIQQLREQRTAKAREARALVDSNPGKWSDELNTQYEAIMAEIERVDAEISRIERVMDAENKSLQAATRRSQEGGTSLDEAQASVEQERAIFNTWIRGGERALTQDQMQAVAERNNRFRSQFNNMSTVVPSEGGYVAPDFFGDRLLEAMLAFGGVRKVARILTTGSGNQINYPTTDATTEEGEIVGENATVTTDDTITFGSVNINAYMYSSKAVAVPFQLLQDSMINMESLVTNRLGTRLARITAKHYTTGTGNNQPRGIVTAAKLGVTAASGQIDSIGYDDLVDLEHSVDPAYRVMGCSWMFNDAALKSLKKLKDGEGRPLWLPGLTTREPDTILSYPYTINQHMAVPAASAKSMLFGNFSYYMIRDVMQVLLFRMTDSAFTLSGQVGFVAFFRTDGNLIAANNDAVRYFIHPAS